MDLDRLARLKGRAAQATKVALEIETLQAASPFGSVVLKFLKFSTNEELMEESLLKKVIEAGRQALMAENEKLLESLLLEPEVPS